MQLTTAASVAATAGGWAASPADAAQAAAPAAAQAGDEFDTLRGRWQALLTGSGFDPTAAPYAASLAALGTSAAGYRGTLAPAASSLWPDLPLGKASNNITQSYVRLKTLALAYVQPGTGVTGDATLATQITTGLDYLAANAYTSTATRYDNWWDWQIGAPGWLMDICVLMYPRLTATQVAEYCAAVDNFVPDSAVAVYSGTSTGANRADLCRVIALRGVIGKDSAKVATAAGALSPTFPYVTTGDGLYADGSFIQHTTVPYTNSYGEVMLQDFSRLLSLFAGSSWTVTDPQLGNILDSVTRAFAPFIYNGLAMDGVSGRAVSRGLQGSNPTPQSDHVRGHTLLSDILRLADSGIGTAQQSAAWKSMVKGWMQRDTVLPYMSDPYIGVPELARAQALLADASIEPSPEPIGHRLFGMDRAVHRRPHWAAALSMCSARTTFYENGNGENLRGWHTNNGMLYWWAATTGNDQFTDAFWPTVNPYRLPGTTVSTKHMADAEGGGWGAPRPAATFAGGATDGVYAAIGQDVRGLDSTLRAKKSWFCLDNAIVCLGAGITGSDGVPIESVIENRNLGAGGGGGGTNALTVDGTHQPDALGWSEQFPNAHLMTIDGVGAYRFPHGASVNALREARTGSWHDINSNSSTTPITRTYLTLWFDHGTDPADASYDYLLMPGADTFGAALRLPHVVLANTANAQAIADPQTGIVAGNFFAAGTAGQITVDAACSVLIRESRGTVTVSVSDPTQTSTTVTVTLDEPAGRIVSCDPHITVSTARHPITLEVDVTGAHGASRTVVLRR